MCPHLIHIYGPVWIASYGVMIALGFVVFIFCTLYHPIRKQFATEENYQNVLFIGLLSGLIGGRVLAVLTDWPSFADNWIEIFFPWVGGLMVLGSIMGILLVVPWYLRLYKIPILPILDLAALYGPLMQAVARFGCFFSGCCYGIPVAETAWYAVRFSDTAGSAPLGIWLQPTQIYASLASFGIFLIIQAVFYTMSVRRGQLIFLYLTLESIARFTVDFWRGDRGDLVSISFLGSNIATISQAQWLSLLFGVGAFIGFVFVTMQQPLARYRSEPL